MAGISTYALNKTLLDASLRTQTSLAQKQVQEATGVVGDTYGDYGVSSQRMISLANEISQAQSWSDNASLAGDRTEVMYSAVGDMVDIISKLRTDISAALSNTDNTTLNAEGQSALDSLAELMNTKSEGRYLFAGSQTERLEAGRADEPETVRADRLEQGAAPVAARATLRTLQRLDPERCR